MSLTNNNAATLRTLWSVEPTYSLVKYLLLKESERFEFEQMEIYQIEQLIETLQEIYIERMMENE